MKKTDQIVDLASETSEMQNNSVSFSLKFPSAGDGDTPNTYWFEVFLINQGLTKNIYTSARTTTETLSDAVNGLMIDARYNSRLINDTTELSVKISLPNCGF